MPPVKYADFEVSEPFTIRAKRNKDEEIVREYVSIKCPHCERQIGDVPFDVLYKQKATKCKAHLEMCPEFKTKGGEVTPAPKRKARDEPTQGETLVTIYKIVYLPDNRAVYTGRTKNTERRMRQHASASSGCRLLRNAIRRHGIGKFAIQPIVRCMPTDADANESYYIMSNRTMHPNGYNLRHGSMAGIDRNDEESALVATGIVNFECAADELRAQSEAALDVATICEDLEDCSATDDVCRGFLREVHPDHAGDRSYSSNEVSAMLNAVRESVRGP